MVPSSGPSLCRIGHSPEEYCCGTERWLQDEDEGEGHPAPILKLKHGAILHNPRGRCHPPASKDPRGLLMRGACTPNERRPPTTDAYVFERHVYPSRRAKSIGVTTAVTGREKSHGAERLWVGLSQDYVKCLSWPGGFGHSSRPFSMCHGRCRKLRSQSGDFFDRATSVSCVLGSSGVQAIVALSLLPSVPFCQLSFLSKHLVRPSFHAHLTGRVRPRGLRSAPDN